MAKKRTVKKTGKHKARAYSDNDRMEMMDRVKLGHPISQVAEKYGVHRNTIRVWMKKAAEAEANDPATEEKLTVENMKGQLARLSAIRNPTNATIHKMAMLSKAIERQEKALKKGKKKKGKPRIVLIKEAEDLLKTALAKAYGLYTYQRKFLKSDAQFRIVLKARQIGFSFVAALDALIAAVSGKSQLFLSASEEQAEILMRYAALHAKNLGIALDGGVKEWRLPNGAVIKCLAHNFRTVQGFTGDIWMDEFAWYPNPKRIWHAFVPSIGAIQGRLTIMSTPFEKDGLFHDLNFDTDRYFMFDRFKVDIYDAIKGGLTFDLETMRALFDEDTWASAYECQFVDDESALFSIDLIKSCADYSGTYFTPRPDTRLYCGYDIARTRDLSCLASMINEKDDPARLTGIDTFKKSSFDDQILFLKNYMNLYQKAQINIDRTGIGMQVAETIKKKFRSRANGIYFTQPIKEFMCLNLKKLFEDKAVRIPNDPILISEIHSIKRTPGVKSMKYDADRTAKGHADRFWAFALAAAHIDTMGKIKKGKAWIM